ncbi:hypothetical protein SH528x_001033 [Novipirellula sp. SH528]|uniref:hypothetical protein n=1 Tax=Novipirellula sp. SH528 TaxID=3454466 RepID=UPI003F9F201C
MKFPSSLMVVFANLVLLTSVFAETSPSDPAASQRPRWAVIASGEVLKSGLADLLNLGLSKNESIALVDRERLSDATRELQFAKILQADNPQLRLQLGKTLNADRLLVLSIEQEQGKPMLRAVVCDANLGVRLAHERFAFPENLPQLTERLAASVDEVNLRFAGGIQTIIAVPSFLSEDFSQRFAHLQSRFSNLLSDSLATYPGVAVVEIEEANAILREQQVTLSDGLRRPIAMIVKGTYTIQEAKPDNPRKVALHIELTKDAADSETIDKSIELQHVDDWLVKTFAKQLATMGSTNDSSLSADLQKAILVRHAERFAELGDWDRSSSLREAALVLDPKDALQRGLVISELQYHFKRDIDQLWFKKTSSTEHRQAILQRAADDYVRALDHLDFLIQNRRVKRADAIGLFQSQMWYKQGAVGPIPDDISRHTALQPACIAQRRFIREVYAAVSELEPGRVLPTHLSDPFYGWQYPLVLHTCNDVIFNHYNQASLESLWDTISRVLPDDANVSSLVMGVMSRDFASETRADHAEFLNRRQTLQTSIGETNDPQAKKLANTEYHKVLPNDFHHHADQAKREWTTFLERLIESDRAVVRLYGHYGRLKISGKQNPLPIVDELESQLTEIKQLGRIHDRELKPLETNLAMTRRRYQAVPFPPPAWKGIEESLGPMRFEPVSLSVQGEPSSNPPPQIKGMLRCGEHCDAFWTQDQFFVMHEPGVLQEIKLTDATWKHALFWEVSWDGECIWLFAHGQGIVAFKPDGTRVATFNARDHVPGYDRGICLLGLSPRRALAVGSFGENQRAWCGVLEIDKQGKPSVDIFFEAKLAAEGRPAAESAADPQTAFRPNWIHRFNSVGGNNTVFVGRSGLKGALEIDLQTRQVSVSSFLNTSAFGRQAFFSHNGNLIASLGGNSLMQYTVADDNRAVRRQKLSTIDPYVDQLLLHDGWLYVPGKVWRRMDPDELQLQRLQPSNSRLPTRYWSMKFGVSAHYGLVGHSLYENQPPLFQISVD